MPEVRVIPLSFVPYAEFLKKQEELLEQKKREPASPDTLWFAEHEPVYTAGVRSKEKRSAIQGIRVYLVKRGGDITYHGPGMLMAYTIFQIEGKWRAKDFVRMLLKAGEETFASFSLPVACSLEHPGLWIVGKKIASIGLNVASGITSHGIAFHLNNDLKPFQAILPCGLSPDQITSYQKEMGRELSLKAFSQRYKEKLLELLKK